MVCERRRDDLRGEVVPGVSHHLYSGLCLGSAMCYQTLSAAVATDSAKVAQGASWRQLRCEHAHGVTGAWYTVGAL